MERVLKESNSHHTAIQKEKRASQEEMTSSINSSPHMLAQRKKLQNLFGGAAQLQGVEEELLQGKFETTQRIEEDELLQGKFDPVQRVEDDEPLQGKFVSASTAQLEQIASKANHTGLPDNLKSGIENLSGMSMDSVKVHYNSAQPAQLNAHAYAQGTDIHVAPGQEQHLPHEAWHVVQQAQGRVKPTMQMKQGVQVNDDEGLEHEADVMGARAISSSVQAVAQTDIAQRNVLGMSNTHTPLYASSLMPVQQTVLQCLLEGDEEPGTQIKVWDEDEEAVLTVYFAGENKGEVYYSSSKLSKKFKLRDMQKIPAKFSFPISYPDKQILREIGLEQEADAALDASGMRISPEVIKFLTSAIDQYMAKNGIELEVQLNSARIQLAFGELGDVVSMFGRGDVVLDEFREVFDCDPDYYLEQIVDSLQRTGTRSEATGGGGEGGGGNEKWSTSRTAKMKKELLHRISGMKTAEIVSEDSTLHHKMSRSRFKRLNLLLSSTPSSQEGVGDMRKFIATVQGLTHSNDTEEALENWAANIELGVLVNKRKEGDDPKEGFDGNYPRGIATPRTVELQGIDRIISSANSGAEVPWGEVAGRLAQTQRIHEAMTAKQGLGPEQFTNPHLEQWHQEPDGFVRDKPGKSSGEAATASRYSVEGESGVPSEIVASVRDFLQDHNYDGPPLLVVSGKNWTCYIRCVLHHFRNIGRYEEVMAEIGKSGVDVTSGVVVGSDEEMRIIAAITTVIGQPFHVSAMDAAHGGVATSQDTAGTGVSILLTGAHFSLAL